MDCIGDRSLFLCDGGLVVLQDSAKQYSGMKRHRGCYLLTNGAVKQIHVYMYEEK